jgi:hypothetical protein
MRFKDELEMLKTNYGMLSTDELLELESLCESARKRASEVLGWLVEYMRMRGKAVSAHDEFFSIAVPVDEYLFLTEQLRRKGCSGGILRGDAIPPCVRETVYEIGRHRVIIGCVKEGEEA